MKHNITRLLIGILLLTFGIGNKVMADNVVMVANGSSTSTNVPTNTYYKYSLTQVRVTKSELGGRREFNSISFYMNSTDSIVRNIRIFMDNVHDTFFTCNSGSTTLSGDWNLDFWGNPGEKVFEGSVTFKHGWTTIYLNRTFRMNGSNGVAITVEDYTGSYQSPAKIFQAESGNTSGSQCRALYYRSDSNPLWTTNGYDSQTGTLASRPTMRLGTMNDGELIIGSDSLASTYASLPANMYYKYSYSQQIFTPLELGGPQTINSISFKRVVNNDTTTRQIHIFLCESGRHAYADTNSWIPLDSLTRVFTGKLKFHSGWNTIYLNTPFHYNGNSNLVLAFYDNTGRYNGQSSFSINPVATNSAIEFHSDSRIPDIRSMHGGTVLSSRNMIRFGNTGGELTVGSRFSSDHISNIPTNIHWGYTYSQQIYLENELNGPAVFTSISFYQTTSYTTTRNITLMLSTSSNNGFGSNTSWLPSSGSSIVYSGTYTFKPGWNTITFQQPFNYYGNGNLVVMMDDNTGSYLSNSPEFLTDTPLGSTYYSIYYRSDTQNPNPASPPSGTRSYMRNVVVLGTNSRNGGLGRFSLAHQGTLPIDASYNYSYSQQLFSPEEMGGPSDISSISLQCVGTVIAKDIRNIDIYLGEVDNTVLSSSGSGAYIPRSSLTKVHSAYRSFTSSWSTFVLDSVFHYSGNKTLVVAFDDNTGSSAINLHFSTVEYNGSHKAHYWISSSNINPSSPSSSALNTANYRNNFIFTTVPYYDALVGDTIFPWPSARVPLDEQYYKYSYSQQVFSPEEMGGANRISGLSFYQTTNTPSNRRVKILLGNVARHRFSSDSHWVPIDSLSVMFDGTLHFDSGRVDVRFPIDFDYNGSGNLVVAFLDSTGSYLSQADCPNFMRSHTSSNKALYYYRDSSPIDISNMSGLSGSLSSYRSVFRFITGPHANAYNITTAINPSNVTCGTTTGAGRYAQGSVVPLTATAADGYHFLYWRSGSTNYSDNPLLVTVSSNKQYVAYFSSCSTPTNLVATPTANSITLSWAGSAASFRVSYKAHGSSSWSSEITTTNSQYTFNNLIDSTEYDFRVRSYCSSSEGYTNYATISQFTLPTPCTQVPSNLTVNSSSYSYISFSWSGSASAYQLAYKSAGESSWHYVQTTDHTQTITDLQPNTTYQIKVRCICSEHSHGSWSSILTQTTQEYPCPAPTNLSQTHTSNSITITWNGTATSYQVAYKLHSASSWNTAVTTTNTTYTFTSLADSTNYDYRVRGYCSSTNQSSWVTGSTVTDPVACNTPTAVAANNVTCSSAVVSWSGSASSYQVSYKASSASTWSTPATVTTTSYNITDLTSSTNYNVRVRAVCSSHSHSAWATANFATGEAACEAPTNLASTHTSNSITITWNGSASNYQVAYKLHSASSWNSAVATSNHTYTFSSLADSTTYDYRVRGNCSSTNQSTWVTGTTTTDPVSCNTPTAVAANSITCSSAVVSWNGTASNYQVSYKRSTDAAWSSPASVSTNTYSLTALDGNTGYQVRVRAVCSTHSHSAWASANFTTLEVPCGTPTNLASTHTSNSITITWNGSASNYQVAYKLHSASSWNSAVATSNHTYTFSSLADSTTYDYRVRGNCSSTNQSTWVTGTTTTDPVSCNTPTAVAANSITCSTAVVSWNGTASNYQVSYKRSTDAAWSSPASVSTNTYSLTALDGNTGYNVRVRAVCSTHSHSAWATASFTTLEVPCSTPTNLASTHTSNSITITWNGTASSYKVAYKLHSASSWNTSVTTTNTTYTFTGLADSTNYDYRVRGYCSSTNQSDWVTGNTTTDPVTCNTPTAVAANNVTCSSAVVSWSGSASSYQVSYKASSASTWSTPATVTTNSYSLTGLSGNTGYNVRVRAVCSTHSHSAWASANFTTLEVPCGTPTNLASTHTSNSITITWNGTATSYQVAYKLHSASSWNTAVTTTNTTYTFTSLADSTNYDYRVRGYCSSTNQSSWVTGSTVTDPVACNTPTAIAANNITCSTAVVSWSGSASSYEVSYKLAAASVWSTPAASSSSSMTLSDLTSSSSYNVRIRAVCSANSHSAWATSTFTTGEAACPDPTSLTASNSSNTITISWSGSASSYDVSYKLHDATNWNSSVSTVNTTYTFTGLTDSTTYDYRVRGNCSSSNQSTWVSGTVTTDPVLCNTPTAVAATNITPSSALITWSGSADSYQLCYKAADSVLWSSPITLASTNYTLSGLEGLTNYQVRVRAECSANSHSTWSTSNFTTLEPPCSPVTNLSESHTATSLTISWMGDADSYQVAYKQFDATSWSSAITVSGFSYTWTGLTSATQYEYRVRSYCSSTNYSEWVSASATLSDSSCTAPSGLATTSTSSFITLSWLSDADSFQVAIKEQSSTSWNASIAESAHSHTFSGLSDSTMYMLRVRAICTSTAQSDWVTISESTLSIVCDQVTNLSVSDVDAQSALVAWQGSAAGYELQYKASDATIWNDVIYTSSLNYQLTGLDANVAYDVHVRAACSDHSHSSWSSISFTTSDSSSDCEVPYDITVLVDRTSAYIYWMGDANVYEFQYRYADDEDGWTMLQEISSYSITLMPLEPEQAYDFRLRSKCDDDNVSDWVLIPFTTLDRHWGLFPTDVTVSNVTDHSAQFQWSPAYDESDWSVHVVGGNLDSIFYTSTNPVICSNLRPNTTYSVSVAALWDGAISDWSEEVFFTTGTSAICEHLQISTVSIYPNPASYTTTITLSGIQGEVLLEIVDNNGRQLMNQSFLSSGNNDFLLDISDLAAGIYFVRLSHQGQQTVTKLIVR